MVGGGKVVSSIFLLSFLMLTTSLNTCRRFPSLKLESLQIARCSSSKDHPNYVDMVLDSVRPIFLSHPWLIL